MLAFAEFGRAAAKLAGEHATQVVAIRKAVLGCDVVNSVIR